MTNIFLIPLDCREVVYHIHFHSDVRSKKALFCLNRIWRQYQETYEKDYLALQNIQTLANRRFRAICEFYNFSLNFEKTHTPFNFNYCQTVQSVTEALNHFYKHLENQEPRLNFIKYLPLEATYSDALKQNKLGITSPLLVLSFHECLELGSKDDQRIAIMKVAEKEVQNENLFILADMAKEHGMDGVVIEVYVKSLIRERQYEQAWIAAGQLLDNQLKNQLYALIADAENTSENSSKSIRTQRHKIDVTVPRVIMESGDDSLLKLFLKASRATGDDRSNKFGTLCHRLNDFTKFEEAVQFSFEINDPEIKSDVLSDAAAGLHSQGQIERALSIAETIVGPSQKFVAHIKMYESSLDDQKFKTLKDLAERIDNMGDRRDAFEDLVKIALMKKKDDWYDLVNPLLQELDVDDDCEEAVDHPVSVTEDVSSLIDKAMQMKEGPKRSIAFHKICMILIEQGKYKLAFEYSDNIENLNLQSFGRLEICKALKQINRLSLMKQIYESIQDRGVKEYAYLDLFSKASVVKKIHVEPIQTRSPQDEWYSNVQEAEREADINNRDQILAILAQEAKEKGWDHEFQFAIGKINDPAFIASFF